MLNYSATLIHINASPECSTGECEDRFTVAPGEVAIQIFSIYTTFTNRMTMTDKASEPYSTMDHFPVKVLQTSDQNTFSKILRKLNAFIPYKYGCLARRLT